jgi:hypothetical protein
MIFSYDYRPRFSYPHFKTPFLDFHFMRSFLVDAIFRISFIERRKYQVKFLHQLLKSGILVIASDVFIDTSDKII